MTQFPKTMKAIVLDRAADDFQLSEKQLPLPECQLGQVLVKVEKVGLNPLDSKLAKVGLAGWQYPHIPGLDAVGTVVQAQPGTVPTVGQRVMWHTDIQGQGTLSEYAVIANHAVSIVPEEVSSEVAASLPFSGMTAQIALEKVQIKEGDTLLVDGAGGAVGQLAIQLAQLKGARVYALAGKRHHARIKKLGVEAVFDPAQANIDKQLNLSIGPQGFDAIIDVLGGHHTERNIAWLRFCGRIACLNGLTELSPELLDKKAPNICIVSLAGAWLMKSVCAQQRMLFFNNALLEKVASGQLMPCPLLDVEFTAQSVKTALDKQLGRGLGGKQIVHVESKLR
ncbi:zinc-binding dehydrogenase [Gayadomonas joobiniege]|uniref:zinc-binding dehydrogenase n=1 Tax=Gayadomonas joobiniege TaxID=1234606 RepID=UPI0003653585|nr:zinc-binding dehydrogenase [Gayadomonas joobiniege]